MTHTSHITLTLVVAAAGALLIPAHSVSADTPGTFLTPEQRQPIFALQVVTNHDLSQSLAQQSQNDTAHAIARIQGQSAADLEAVRQVGQVAVTMQQPLPSSRVVDSLNTDAAIATAQIQGGASMVASAYDAIAREQEARWPAQAQIYQTTADAQLKLAEMIGGMVGGGGMIPTGGAGSGDAVGSLIGLGSQASLSSPPQPASGIKGKPMAAVSAPRGVIDQTSIPGGGTLQSGGDGGSWLHKAGEVASESAGALFKEFGDYAREELLPGILDDLKHGKIPEAPSPLSAARWEFTHNWDIANDELSPEQINESRMQQLRHGPPTDAAARELQVRKQLEVPLTDTTIKLSPAQ